MVPPSHLFVGQLDSTTGSSNGKKRDEKVLKGGVNNIHMLENP
jgi:hypothetical protein